MSKYKKMYLFLNYFMWRVFTFMNRLDRRALYKYYYLER